MNLKGIRLREGRQLQSHMIPFTEHSRKEKNQWQRTINDYKGLSIKGWGRQHEGVFGVIELFHIVITRIYTCVKIQRTILYKKNPIDYANYIMFLSYFFLKLCIAFNINDHIFHLQIVSQIQLFNGVLLLSHICGFFFYCL